tara:strand:- start:1457 stop:2794 length:1338 start_codon:yes stop_codon:yes gene_type:complete
MGTGYTRNDTGNNIADGNVINASDLDGEFDAVVAAFNGSSGHSHDGSSGEGPPIAAAGIANNAVELGTKTTGNYVATITGGTGIASTGATSGETIAHTLSVDLSELTDMTQDMVGTDEFIVLDNGADRRKAANEIPLSIFDNDSGFTTTSGTVTSVALTAGNLIDVSGSTITSSGTFTVNVDLSELTDMTQTIVTGDEFVVLDDGAQKRKAASEIPLSIFNNDSGFTTNTGDITGVTAGTGLSGGGSSGGVTLALDFSELTDMTGDISGSTEFILQDGTTESRKAASEIKLSNFNNDSGFTTTSGTVTSVALSAGDLIDISGSTITSSGTFTVNVDLSELTDMTQTITNSDEFVVLDGSVQKRKQASEIPISIFNNDSGFITSSSTSLPIENSSNATQFTSTNSTGLQFAAGGSASVAFDATNKRVTYTVTESDPAALAFAIALG